MQSEHVIFLDMDGVITDFDTGFKKLSGGLTGDEYRALHGRTEETSLFLSRGNTFWESLKWMPGGKELLSFVFNHFKSIRILSSAGTGTDWNRFKKVQIGKMTWLAENAPYIPKKHIIIVPFASLKSRHSGPNRILVDDKDTTIKQWRISGGVGILHFGSTWQNTINELQKYSVGNIKLREIVESI